MSTGMYRDADLTDRVAQPAFDRDRTAAAETLWFGRPDHPGRGGLPLAPRQDEPTDDPECE